MVTLKAIGRIFAPRMGLWLYLSIALVLGVWWAAPHMLKVLLWKFVLLTTAAFIGDKVARFMEGANRRPHEFLAEAEKEQAHGTSLSLARARELEQRADAVYLRRALIIAAAMVAAALGS